MTGALAKALCGISAFALFAVGRAKCGRNCLRLVVRFEVGLDVRLFLFVGGANGIGSGLGAFKCIGDSERDILAVVANDIVFEWRATLIDDAFESRSLR